MKGFFEHLVDRHQAGEAAIRPRLRSRFESESPAQVHTEMDEVDQSVPQDHISNINQESKNRQQEKNPDLLETESSTLIYQNDKTNNLDKNEIPQAELTNTKPVNNDNPDSPASSLSTPISSIEASIQPQVETTPDLIETVKKENNPESVRKQETGQTNRDIKKTLQEHVFEIDQPAHFATSNPAIEQFLKTTEVKDFEPMVLEKSVERKSLTSQPIKTQMVHTDSILTEKPVEKKPLTSHPIKTQAVHSDSILTRMQNRLYPFNETEDVKSSIPENTDTDLSENNLRTLEITQKIKHINQDSQQEKQQTGIHETPAWVANLQSQFNERWHEEPVDTEPVVNVTIGRVEVRAVKEEKPQQGRPTRKKPSSVMTLDDYLKKREGSR